jgi:hypothetical protein
MNDFEYLTSLEIRMDLKKYNEKSIIPVPHRLFRYTGLNEYVNSDLTNSQLKPVDPSIFNDIYDSSLLIDSINGRKEDFEFLKGIYQKADKMYHYNRIIADRKRLDEMITDHFKSHFRICCFSTTNIDIKMWGLYADYNKGICIEYDFYESENNIIKFIFPVSYKDEPFDATKLSEIENRVFLALLVSILTKYSTWSYEKEWRIVVPCMENCKDERITLDKIPKPKRIFLGKNIGKVKKSNSLIWEQFVQYISHNGIETMIIKNKHNSYQYEVESINILEI